MNACKTMFLCMAGLIKQKKLSSIAATQNLIKAKDPVFFP